MGLIHLYCGDGKGKTTAAIGLAVRCAGAGGRVIFTQFFKDGSSSELRVLESLPGVRVLVCPRKYGFFKRMSEEEKAAAREDYTALLRSALAAAREGAELLVLDEAVSACNHGIVPEEELLDFLRHKPEGLEAAVTGRNPSDALMAEADYITEMVKRRHPFDRGVAARKGVEF